MSVAPDPRLYEAVLYQGRYAVNNDVYAVVLDFQSRLGRVKASYELDSLLTSLVASNDKDADPALYHLKITDRTGSAHHFLWRLR